MTPMSDEQSSWFSFSLGVISLLLILGSIHSAVVGVQWFRYHFRCIAIYFSCRQVANVYVLGRRRFSQTPPKSIKETSDTLAIQLSSERRRVTDLGLQLEEGRRRIDDLESQLAVERQRSSGQQEERERRYQAEIQTAVLKERLTCITGESEKLEAERRRFEANKVRLEVAKARLESDKTRLEVAKARLESDKTRLESDKTRLKAEKKELQNANTKLLFESRRSNFADGFGTGRSNSPAPRHVSDGLLQIPKRN
jgi:hypothetical protein